MLTRSCLKSHQIFVSWCVFYHLFVPQLSFVCFHTTTQVRNNFKRTSAPLNDSDAALIITLKLPAHLARTIQCAVRYRSHRYHVLQYYTIVQQLATCTLASSSPLCESHMAPITTFNDVSAIFNFINKYIIGVIHCTHFCIKDTRQESATIISNFFEW